MTVRDAESGEELGRAASPSDDPRQVVVSPDGRWLVVGAGRSLYVWPADDPTATPAKVLNPANRHFTGLAFHPAGGHLFAACNDATVKLFDPGSWRVARTYTWGIGRLRSLAITPDGTRAAAGSQDGKIVIWDVAV
ncbi:MAG: hypothetical protein K2X87_34130 [Gemmataceae bacterium]|nr:hypothetical protein [Gemmataceae bacterium]